MDKTTGPILVGSLVTYFLRKLHGYKDVSTHEVLGPVFLAQEKMKHMKGVRVVETGEVYWSYPQDLAAAVGAQSAII